MLFLLSQRISEHASLLFVLLAASLSSACASLGPCQPHTLPSEGKGAVSPVCAQL